MTALKLYKFLEDNAIEIDWRGEELVVWIHFSAIEEFVQMLGSNFLAEGGHEVSLQESGIALDIVPICEYSGIEPTDMLSKE